MKLEKMVQINSEIGDVNSSGVQTIVSYEQILTMCRAYIADNAGSYRDLDPSGRSARIRELILSFNLRNNTLVDGYIDDSGRKNDATRLLEALTDSIQNYGILTAALNDNDINEIRSNGRYIKAEKLGRCIDLRDAKGRILKFSSPEEQEIIMRKMLCDVVFNPTVPIVNATTLEGYRLAAVHYTCTSQDPHVEYGSDNFHSFVLRKLDTKKRGLGDIVRAKTMSDDMARTAALFLRTRSSFYTCGPTASGKSTTNNAIIQEAPIDVRLVILQNVGEIDGRIRDPKTGDVVNDVVHLLYKDMKNPGPNDPTQKNMSDQILRFSPVIIVFGEWRADEEFVSGTQYAKSGHPHNATMHAYDTYGALKRVQDATKMSMEDVCHYVNFIIIQRIMPDGVRRVLEMAEIAGVEKDDKSVPIINMLYRFKQTGDPKYRRDGTIAEIPGYHERVGTLTEKTAERFGEYVSKKQFSFLMKEKDTTEVQTYTGLNISKYGLTEEDYVD